MGGYKPSSALCRLRFRSASSGLRTGKGDTSHRVDTEHRNKHENETTIAKFKYTLNHNQQILPAIIMKIMTLYAFIFKLSRIKHQGLSSSQNMRTICSAGGFMMFPTMDCDHPRQIRLQMPASSGHRVVKAGDNGWSSFSHGCSHTKFC